MTKILTDKQTKSQLTGDGLFTALIAACRGLIYISETDAGIEPILARSTGELTIEEFVRTRLPGKNQRLEFAQPDAFFDRLTTDQEWHSDADRKAVRRFRRLKKIIFDNLRDVSLVRAGRVRIEIFVLGYDAAGNIAGISTRSIET